MKHFTEDTYAKNGYFDKEYRIYGIKHPTTDEIFYVGQTRKPLSDRLHGHIKAAQGKFEKFKNEQKDAYILNIIKGGLRPKMICLEKIKPKSFIDFLEITEREVQWMKTLKKDGHKLLNIIGLKIPHLNAKYLIYLEQLEEMSVDKKYYYCGEDGNGNDLYDKNRILKDGGVWVDDKIPIINKYNPFENERFLKKMGISN